MGADDPISIPQIKQCDELAYNRLGDLFGYGP